MDTVKKEKLIAKFLPILNNPGGIFTSVTRAELLGIERHPGKKKPVKNKEKAKIEFWFGVRRFVKNTLLDLQLFIEVAGKDNLNQVITKESLTPIIEALLMRTSDDDTEPDLNLAEIAQMLIQNGFDYLSRGERPLAYDMPSILKRTQVEAIELSHYLVSDIKAHKQALDEKRKIDKTKATEPKEQSLAESKNEGEQP